VDEWPTGFEPTETFERKVDWLNTDAVGDTGTQIVWNELAVALHVLAGHVEEDNGANDTGRAADDLDRALVGGRRSGSIRSST
jgi:hypothetical protein